MVMLLQISHSWSFNGFISGDTSALINYASKAYNDKDVAAANLITISGLTRWYYWRQICQLIILDEHKTVLLL